MRVTLATLLAQSVKEFQTISGDEIDPVSYLNWMDRYQAQLIVLSAQIAWSELCENSLQQCTNGNMDSMQKVLKIVEGTLNVLADSVLQEQPPVRRKKLEHMVSISSRIEFIVMINCIMKYNLSLCSSLL